MSKQSLDAIKEMATLKELVAKARIMHEAEEAIYALAEADDRPLTAEEKDFILSMHREFHQLSETFRFRPAA